jgi:hypothetical protein
MFQQNSCIFIAQGAPTITMDTSSQDIKQFMFQASGGKDIDAVM